MRKRQCQLDNRHDPLSKEFHERQVYIAQVANMSFDEIQAEWDRQARLEPKRARRPVHINPGVSWTTKEMSDWCDKKDILVCYMTRDEAKKIIK